MTTIYKTNLPGSSKLPGRSDPLELLFEQFDQLITHPADIPRLNELILQLAVQGKLVPQNPADEPASVLLERIVAEKAQLVEAGRIKNEESQPAITKNGMPYELPIGWNWVRLIDVTIKITDGEHISPNTVDNGVPLLSAKNIGDRDLDFSKCNFVTMEDAEKFWRRCDPEDGDILVVSRGGGVGRSIISRSDQRYCLMGSVLLFKPSKHIDYKYLYYFLISRDGNRNLRRTSSATAQPAIYITHLKRNYFLPLPPLAEQKRIVEKVESLLAQTRAFETQLAQAGQERANLNKSALHRLLTAPTPDDAGERWQLIAANFDSLYSGPAAVDDLKQAILQLAVQGKLVPQNPDDEPALLLLERIAAEKARLVKDGKIRKSKPLPPIGEDEIPYVLPKGWQWVRLDNFSDIGTGSTPLKSNGDYYEDGTISWVTSSATSNLFVSEASEYITDLAVKETRLRRYPKNTLIVALYGQGKTRGQISELLIEATINQALAAIVLEDLAPKIRPYIKLFFLKNYQDLRNLAEGGAQPNLNVGKVKSLPIPLPPLAEQKRIVEKVECLLGLCDSLQNQLVEGEAERSRLLASVLAGVVD